MHTPAVRRPRFATLLPALLPAATALLLAGCSVLSGGQRDPITIYAPEPTLQADPAWPTVHWQLAVAKPNAARLVDSPRIGVRPVPGELQVYAGAIWSQPPTDLVESSVVRVLEDSGKIQAVGRLTAGLRADYRLVMDLRRFEADYAGGALPAATIEINAKILHNATQRVVANRTFLQTQPAPTTDIASVATAFNDALARITLDIAGWTLTQGQADAAQALPHAPAR